MESLLSMGDRFLEIVNQIIEDNLDNEYFSVEDLAQKAGLSRSMLHRKLIKLTGKSATDLIMEIRLIRARELLENDVATVSEIAYKVGFNSVSYFHRAFKKRFKVSPGDIKNIAAASLYQQSDDQNPETTISKKSQFSRLRIPALLILLAIIIAGSIIYYLSREEKISEKSIAILPFDNLSSNEENRYFADGIVEDLLTRLSKIKDLKVISRTSSETFKNKENKTVPEIAEILGVKYILEGSVQRTSDKVRISIQLIDAPKDDHILSEQYDRNISEIFKLQGDIASEIVDKLSLILTDQQLTEILKNQTNNMEALNYYQIGYYHLCRCSREESLASIDYYNKALHMDSNYAQAYAGLAEAYRVMYSDGFVEREKKIRDTAYMYAKKALDIDKNIAEAHTVLATIYYMIDFDIAAAEREFHKAMEISSNNSLTYKEYARFLCITGKPEKAREYMNKAIALDPYSFSIRHNSTIMYITEKNYSKALEENNISLEIVKDHPYAVDRCFFIYLGLGNEKAALESFKKAGIIRREYTEQQADSAYRKSGINGLLRLKAATYVWRAGRAQCYIMLGESEKAIETLELALSENKLNQYYFYQIDKKGFETDPRLIEIKKKLGMEKY